MADKNGISNLIDKGKEFIAQHPKAVPGVVGGVGAVSLFSGLFGRKEKTDDDGSVHKESIFNFRTLLGGVLSVTAFTMIARKNGMQPEMLKNLTDKIRLPGRG